ncbi:integrase [Corynebacterium sp. 13CS0277]|uniref:site-specific integrase n=1 Tax=Corynebacterium sp. 13CS0277 TaxID=2071994 RepID=UPI000D04701B|nr:site-specific integrase [Corynebacterium sp. 13CS0277]PRQ10596.1 integrase [Corynebacterium sp. 13CS0277]
MATVTKYESAKGTRYRVQYTGPDGKRRQKRGFIRKIEAQAWADANATSITTGAWIDPQAGRTTVEQVAATWWAGRQHLKPSTLKHDRERLDAGVLPMWGHRQVASIRPSEVQAWVGGMDKSAATVRHYHSILSQILGVAVSDGLIPANPAKGVNLPRKAKPRHVYLTPAQVELLSDCAGERAPIVWLLATVGLRWGELAGLQVGDVDLERGRIAVRRNAVWLGGTVEVGTPKTHEEREVAVMLPVLRMLAPLVEGRPARAWLFPGQDGAPMQRVNGTTGWLPHAVRRAQMRDPDFPRVTPHGLRHVAAGLMVSAGANVKVVQRQLGHATASMTLDTYADLFDTDLDGVAASLVGLFEGEPKMSQKRGLRVVEG